MNILKKNLYLIYKRYLDFYEEKYTINVLGHGEEDFTKPKNKEQEKDGYFELITETGFYIYFLISHYLELDFFD